MATRKAGDKSNNEIDWVSISIYGTAFLASVGAALAALYWLLPKSKLEPGVDVCGSVGT